MLCVSIVSAQYSKPPKYRGLSGIVKPNTKPVIKVFQIGIPSQLAKQTVLKQRSLSLLGKSGFNFVNTKTAFLNSFKLDKKYGSIND